jgi:cytochrome c556
MVRAILVLTALSAGAFAATAVLADQDTIKTRQELMKRSGQHMVVMNQMMRGVEKFDVAKVNAAFDAWADKAAKLPVLFPDDSRTGETRALPKIWDDAGVFRSTIAKFAQGIADNRAKAVVSVEDLTAAVPAILNNCNGCHDAFRRPRR